MSSSIKKHQLSDYERASSYKTALYDAIKEMQHAIDQLSVIYMETLEPQDPLVGGGQSNLSSDDARCSIIKLSDRIHGAKNHIDSIMK